MNVYSDGTLSPNILEGQESMDDDPETVSFGARKQKPGISWP